jgi:lipoprotein-anchoring transpeptidase ErfK/SrfK
VSSSLGNNFAAQSQSATGIDVGLAPDLQRQVINYPTIAAPFTVVIDTEHTYLYYVLGEG